MDINKESMTNFLDSLLGAFENEKLERVSKIKESIEGLNLNWKDPEDIEALHISRLLEHVDVIVKEVYPGVSRNDLHKIQFIYKNYSFIENNVRSMVDLGRGCCADKSRWLINNYIKHLVSGQEPKIPLRTDKKHSYYHPDFGTFKEWHDFIDGLINLYYRGITESNMENTMNLLKQQTAVKEEMNKEYELANSYLSTYIEKVKGFVNGGLLSNEDSEIALSRYNTSVIIFGLIQEIKNNTITDEMILDKIKERCERK